MYFHNVKKNYYVADKMLWKQQKLLKKDKDFNKSSLYQVKIA